MTQDEIARLIETALATRQGRQVEGGTEIEFLCARPEHPETTPSAQWNRKKGTWHCKSCGAGGGYRALAKLLGITIDTPKQDSRIIAEYDYTDANGTLLYQVVRMEPKDFMQRQPDGAGGWNWSLKGVQRVLYALPRLTASQGRVYLCEGEKDADALNKRDLTATTNAGGADYWAANLTAALAGREIVICEDNDAAGVKRTGKLVPLLTHAGATVKVLRKLSEKKGGDVSDWLAAGGTAEALNDLADAVPVETLESAEPIGVNGFQRSDSGNAELYAHLYGDRVRYDHLRERWLVWARHRWQSDPDGELIRMAKDLARRRYHDAGEIDDTGDRRAAAKFAIDSEGKGRIEATLALARSEFPITDAGTGWDDNPFLLGLDNGVANLITGQLRDGKADDRITLNTDVPYDANARCPLWLKTIENIFSGDEEMLGFVQRAVGYSITGATGEQCWFLCYGNGANGKSTVLETIYWLLGGTSHTSYAADTPITTFAKSSQGNIPADIAALAGKRFVMCTESDDAGALNSARVKSLTGGDPQTGRFMRENFFTYIPVMKLWLASNDLPKVKDSSDGFWRRVMLIPFLQKFEGAARDLTLKDKLRLELPGILNWAIEGAVKWKRGGLLPPRRVLLATLDYRWQSDPLGEFKTDCCVFGANERIEPAVLFKRYLAWAEAEGINERGKMGRDTFLRSITAGGVKSYRSHAVRWLVGVRVRRHDENPEIQDVTRDEAPDSTDAAGCHLEGNSPVDFQKPFFIAREPEKDPQDVTLSPDCRCDDCPADLDASVGCDGGPFRIDETGAHCNLCCPASISQEDMR